MTTAMGKSIGETLRDGRLHQRLSIAECAKRTHISQRYLEALEEERWSALPSESHRVGFLRLYAQFLGVYSDDMVQSYKQAMQQQQQEKAEKQAERPVEIMAPSRFKPSVPVAGPRFSLIVLLVLVSVWGVYHGVKRFLPQTHMDLSWLKFKPRAPRLVSSRSTTQIHRIKAKAESDGWVRVMDNQQLLFEGILAGGVTKEWSGQGPFRIKVNGVRAVSILWNDQPVDLLATARGNVVEIKIPPSAE